MTRSRKRKLQRLQAKRPWKSVATATAAILAGTTAGHAQQVDSSTELQEVVVTAQKRTEDLQKVPISVTVLSGSKLADLQVNSFDDYAKYLPSLTYESLGPGQAELYFRGVSLGSNQLHAGSLPAVGLYVDETPITTIASAVDLHAYDLQRVEALAGPQGTLFGASSLSGTLRIITNKPDPSGFSAGYDLQANDYTGHNGGGQFEGYVNIPISSNAAVRLVGYYGQQGGYISNVPASRTYCRNAAGTPSLPDGQCGTLAQSPDQLTVNNYSPPPTGTGEWAKSNFNPIENYGGRLALKVDLDDRWSITPSIIYQNEKTNGTFVYDPKLGALNVADFAPDYSKDSWYQAALVIEGKLSNWDFVYSGGYFNRNTTIASDYSEYTVAYDYNGYMRFRDNAGQLIDPTQQQLQIDNYTKVTNEARISSPVTDVVRFTLGLFAQQQTDTIRDEYIIPGLGDSLAYNYSVQGQPNILYLSQQDRVDRDYAIFGDATWQINDQFALSAGIRGFIAYNTLYGFFGFNNAYANTNNGDNYSHESGSGTNFCTPQLTGNQPVVPGANLPCVNTDSKVYESGETHRINLTYQIDPNAMVYATYSTGFRPGGPNRRAGLEPYNSDTLTNYEIGWKTGWLNHTIRWNGAIFYELWNGIQETIPGPNGINDLFNIGNADIKGAETEFNWLLWGHLQLTLAGTYIDAKTTTAFCGENSDHTGVEENCAVPSVPVGTRLPVTPEVKANAIARYQFDAANLHWYAQAAALHQSSANPYLQTVPESLAGPTDPFTSLDIAFGASKNSWSAEFFVTNVFDTLGQLNKVSQCGAANGYCYENSRLYTIKPRLIGIKFGQKF